MDNILLDIGGKEFYFDVDALSEAVKVENLTPECKEIEEKENNPTQIPHNIDVAKYELYRDLVNTLLNCNEIVDDKLGMLGLNALPIPFKLSLNTLLMKGIIKEL